MLIKSDWNVPNTYLIPVLLYLFNPSIHISYSNYYSKTEVKNIKININYNTREYHWST